VNLARASMLALGTAAALVSVDAAACSVSGRPAPTAAERIAGRDDLRQVTGSFRIEDISEANHLERQIVRGSVTRANGKSYPVSYEYMDVWVQCLIYVLPQGEAEGVFYLSRRSGKDGRYELVDWTGRYVEGKVIGYPEGQGQ